MVNPLDGTRSNQARSKAVGEEELGESVQKDCLCEQFSPSNPEQPGAPPALLRSDHKVERSRSAIGISETDGSIR